MKITATTLPNSRRRYTANLTEPETAEYYQQATARLAESVKVAGFRPGKAPANLVRDQLDAEKLREEAYSLAVRDAWSKVMTEVTDNPIEDPAVEIVAFGDGQVGELTFAFDVRPPVKVSDIAAIKLTGLKKPVISTADVDDVLSALSKGHAQSIVKLTPAQLGDKMEVTFDGYLKNVKQEKLSSKHFPLVLGENTVIPGFAEQLVGLKKGDVKKFPIEFPKDHFDKQLAGQKVEFAATVDEVFDVILPKIDDKFAEKFGHDKLTELKKAIEVDLKREKDEEFFTAQKAKWLAEFEKKVTVELPESLIAAEISRSRDGWQKFLTERHLQPEAWLKQRDITMAALEADWRQAARSSVIIGLGLAELAEQQKRELKTNEDYQTFLDELVKKTV